MSRKRSINEPHGHPSYPAKLQPHLSISQYLESLPVNHKEKNAADLNINEKIEASS